LSERRAEVYAALFAIGPATANECFQHLAKNLPFDGNVHARFVELRAMGLAEELGTKTCRTSGRKAILWDVTDRVVPLPYKRPEDTPSKSLLEEVNQIAMEALIVLQKASEDYADLILRAESVRLRGELADWRKRAKV